MKLVLPCSKHISNRPGFDRLAHRKVLEITYEANYSMYAAALLSGLVTHYSNSSLLPPAQRQSVEVSLQIFVSLFAVGKFFARSLRVPPFVTWEHSAFD